MPIRTLILAVLIAQLGAAEILDRIAVTLDNRVIAESDLIREIQLSAFLNAARPDFSGTSKRAAAERLVERALMRREMEFSSYPAPGADEAVAALEKWRRERFAAVEAYHRALIGAKIVEQDLRRFLLEQLTALRFIDYRFRPGVQVLPAEVRDYYEKRFLAQSRAAGVSHDPPLEDVAERIEKILAEEKIDRMLDAWMKDARSRTRIVFRAAVFE
jgi:peptidyl-prolyl cis-trans isomerase SurA